MTPRIRKLRNAGVTITISGAAIVAVLGWMAPRIRSAATPPSVTQEGAPTFVRQDTFDLFRKDLAADIREIRRLLAFADSSRRCDKGHKEFCP